MRLDDHQANDYADALRHHHTTSLGDAVAAWCVVVVLGLVAAFGLGLDHVAASGFNPVLTQCATAAAPSSPG
jgi:hypothetical protein